jgi:murein DD-endopeptidase MepM/ murein hydrolase activator NlpD
VIDGTLKDMPTPNGYKYVKVSTESKNIRYVAKDFLTTGKCETSMVASGTSVNGYFFPTTTSTGFSYIASRNRPRQHPGLTGFAGYRSNWGLYGANRSGGRSHAANDLYQPRGMSRPGKAYTQKYYGGPFRAITAGRVLRKPIPFYLGTFETAILHEDGVVSRYGEIYPTTVYKSSRVKAGERIGYIKWVGQNSVAPMLHFENYYAKNNSVKTGSLRGSKRINGKNSRRSEHLFDRTKVMRDLEAKSFR